MPILDMSLAELKQYRGINPMPNDMNTYWQRALAELEQVQAKVEWKETVFTVPYARCYDLYFTGVRGARIHSKVLIPTHKEGKMPAVLQFHGYRGNAGNWFDKLPYAAAGYVTAAMDCRGQTGYSQDPGGVKGSSFLGHFIRGIDDHEDNMLMRHTFLDTVQLARIIMAMPEVDAQRVAAYGCSQGGALALACAALEPGIRMVSAIHPFLSDYRRVWEMDLCDEAYEEIRSFFKIYDPLHLREEEIFMRLGYIDIKNLAHRVKARALFAVTQMDNICPPSTQFAVFNRLTCEKQLLLYKDFGHEYVPGHDDLVFEFLMGL